ncbi:MAG: PilZ domain-containing protein [Hyphomicrobiaceae bacterium]
MNLHRYQMPGQSLSLNPSSQSDHESPDRRSGIERKAARFPVRIRAVLQTAQSFQSTIIQDLSLGGAGLDGAVGVVPGDRVSIELLDGRSITGRVKWWLAGKCGIAFDEPLDPNDPLFSKNSKRVAV